MVYYRPSIVYWLHCALIRGVLAGQLLKKSLNQIFVNSSDGFFARTFARTFTKGEPSVLLTPHFRDIKYTVLGLKAELFPIPRGRFKVGHRQRNSRLARAIHFEPLGINDLRPSRK
jgi:hypothetical protein